MIKRLALTILLSSGLIYGGLKWSEANKKSSALGLSVDFKASKRLLFDENNLEGNPKHLTQNVKVILRANGVDLEGLMTALPNKHPSSFSALLLELGEDQPADLRSYFLIHEDLLPQTNEPISQGLLSINGKVHASYRLFAHPFHQALALGLGPLAHTKDGKMELSQLSERMSILRRLGEKNARLLPPAPTNNWFAWSEKEQSWQAWGEWPEEWPL